MNKHFELRAPIHVPIGWLVAIIGASSTAVLTAFSIGFWVAALSAQVQANKEASTGVPERLVRVETILEIQFPNAAAQARRITNGP
jgi:hypothetical protein